MDANACISYWTIEHRGPVPEQRRAAIGSGLRLRHLPGRLPLELLRHAPTTLSFATARLRGLDPVEILGMDEATFRARFSGTPLMRAKWEGMRRNACLVLGSTGDPGDPRAREALAGASGDPDVVIRDHAAWALKSLKERGLTPPRNGR